MDMLPADVSEETERKKRNKYVRKRIRICTLYICIIVCVFGVARKRNTLLCIQLLKTLNSRV